MPLQDQISEALQNMTSKISADIQNRHQQLLADICSISKPEPIHMGSINLDDLVPDISSDLHHVIALMQAAFDQLERKPTASQIEISCWLLSDALKEARSIYQNLYGTSPLEKDA